MTWDRPTLKFYAKEQLKQYYWIAFAVCLVGGVLGGSSGGGMNVSVSLPSGSSFSSSSSSSLTGPAATADGNTWILLTILIVALFVFVFAIAFLVFVGNPVRVGMCSFFQAAPWGNREFTLLFSSFKQGRYKPIVKTMFRKELSIFLWSLLFVIPGIIKAYQYYMVPYLISEYPYLTPREAMELSSQMTQGHKFDIFALELSFIGWYLLGMLALFVGMIFVTPYVEATNAQLYYALRQGVAIPPPPGYQNG